MLRNRATIIQKKTGRPFQFELSEQTRGSLEKWIATQKLLASDFLFPSRSSAKPHLSTRQYGRIVDRWVASIGLDQRRYGTHSLRRTKVTQIYKKTGNLRAIQLLLGHTKLESTVRYLGIEVDDALAMSEQVDL
jgi:integrase